MKNKLTDLNDHLFMQLERLGDEDLTPDQIDIEARRAAAMVEVSDQILEGAKVHLKAAEIAGRYSMPLASIVPQIEHGSK